MLFVGIAILIVLFIATNIIEINLKSIKKTNEQILELLKDIRDK